MNFKMMMALASGKLKEFLQKNKDAMFCIGFDSANQWLQDNKQPFEVGYDEVEKKVFIKYISKVDKE